MTRSMTGFGRGEAARDGLTITVELKAVNHRFLDLALRLPRELAPLEAAVQRRIKERLRRGRVEVAVRRAATAAVVVEADERLFAAWLDAVDRLLGGGEGEAVRAAAVAHVLAQPGVLEARAADVDAAAEEPVLMEALDRALDGLVAMRAAEGAQLAAELERHLDALLAEVDAVDAEVADLSERLYARLLPRIEKLVGDRVEPWRLAQEAALLADRADVAEEIARLRSHGAQIREALAGGGEVGRRLDFLLQEVHREINTLGSKAVDQAVLQRVVAMKTLLERMREQAANVE